MLNIPDKDNLPVQWSDTFRTLDSSKLECYQTCERLFFFTHVLGLRAAYTNHNLAFGDAWHQGMEVLYQIGYTKEGLKAAFAAFEKAYDTYYENSISFDHERAPKNKANAFLAFNQYVECYKTDNFKVIDIEAAGRVPIDDEGHELVYRLDTILEDSQGLIFSYEHKTGSALFSWYLQHWKTKIQVGTYTHALQTIYGHRTKHIIIDAVLFKKSQNEFYRIPVPLSKIDYAHWREQVLTTIRRVERDFQLLADATPNDEILACFPKRTPSCVKYNRICPMYNICFNNVNPLRWAKALPSDYTREYWNPEKHNKPKELKNASK